MHGEGHGPSLELPVVWIPLVQEGFVRIFLLKEEDKEEKISLHTNEYRQMDRHMYI